jgi:hypothetical protein
MQGPDLDRLDLGKPVNGEYRLMVTNEALETHYVNSLSLMTVDHPAGYEPFPTDKGKVVMFGREAAGVRSASRAGLDVTTIVSSRDSVWYESDTAMLRQLTDSIVRDWVDVAVPKPRGARRMCLAFRTRSTLLNTVLFYDGMLKSQGARAIDWMGFRSYPYLYRLSRWYDRNFGLHVKVFDGKAYREKTWFKDPGPIVWHDAAAELPVPEGDTVRLRLEFLPDNIMIDWVGVSFDGRFPAGRVPRTAAGLRTPRESAGTTCSTASGARTGAFWLRRRAITTCWGSGPARCRPEWSEATS